MYCPKCGKEVPDNSVFCPNCSARLVDDTSISSKSRLAASLLCILPSWFLINGVHRFYLGKIGTGLLMLFTLGGLGIWTLIDFIFAVAGLMNDKDGKPIKNW